MLVTRTTDWSSLNAVRVVQIPRDWKKATHRWYFTKAHHIHIYHYQVDICETASVISARAWNRRTAATRTKLPNDILRQILPAVWWSSKTVRHRIYHRIYHSIYHSIYPSLLGVGREDQASPFTAWLPWSASDMGDEWHYAGCRRQMRAKPTNHRRDAPVVHGAFGGGVSNLPRVWMHHQDWRECKWSQRAKDRL